MFFSLRNFSGHRLRAARVFLRALATARRERCGTIATTVGSHPPHSPHFPHSLFKKRVFKVESPQWSLRSCCTHKCIGTNQSIITRAQATHFLWSHAGILLAPRDALPPFFFGGIAQWAVGAAVRANLRSARKLFVLKVAHLAVSTPGTPRVGLLLLAAPTTKIFVATCSRRRAFSRN